MYFYTIKASELSGKNLVVAEGSLAVDAALAVDEALAVAGAAAAIVVSTAAAADLAPAPPSRCQCLYFCTSKSSKLVSVLVLLYWCSACYAAVSPDASDASMRTHRVG